MDFFGVGPLELALVAIIAVIVLGPERLPVVAVQVARVIKSLRGFATDATSGLRKEFEELTRDYEDLHREFRDLKDSIQKDADSVASDLTTAVDEATIEASGEPPPETSR
jgi:Tat protein translocase TatB subunit